MSKVTVIIPTYNRADVLPRAIRSVLEQTFTDWRLLIVDDGSTDDTRPLVDEWVRSDKQGRIVGHWHRTNRGQGAALNAAMAHVDTEYVALLDSDDEYVHEFLERHIAALDSGFDLVRSNGHWNAGRRRPDIFDALLDRQLTFDAGGACVFRRSCFVPFDEDMRYALHRDWFLRMAQHCEFAWFPDRLVIVHEDAGNRVTGFEHLQRKINASEYFIAKHWAALSERPHALATQYWLLARLYRQAGNHEGVRRAMWAAVMAAPLRWRLWPEALASLAGPSPHRWAMRLAGGVR